MVSHPPEKDNDLFSQNLSSYFNEVVFDYLYTVSAALAVVIAVFVAFDAAALPEEYRTIMVVHDVVVLLAAVAVHGLVRWRRQEAPEAAASAVPWHRNANVWSLGLALVTMSSIVHLYAHQRNPITAMHLAILVMGTAVVVLHRGVLSVVMIASVVAWVLLGVHQVVTSAWIPYTITLFSGCAIAALVHEGRLAIHTKHLAAQLAEREARRRLSDALQEVEREVAERKRAQEARERLEVQLRQAQKLEAVGRLAGGVAHDINNMLAAITGTAQVLAEELASPSHLEDVASILSACERGRQLTRNLLGFARQGRYRQETVDLNDLVTTVHAFIQRALPSSIRFDLNLESDLPPVWGDRRQLNQVVLNLVNNAVDAMSDEGHLVVKTSRVPLVEQQGVAGLEADRRSFVKMVVSDTGHGMTNEALERAFEPFFTTKAAEGSTGLGLSMVYGTIANHGGTVLLRSALGQGTAVTVYLPVSTHTAEHPDPVEAERSAVPSKPVVLVVDDEPLVRRSSMRALTRMGYEVLLADGGRQAVDIVAHRSDIDVVILDLIMPDMGGDEVFSVLRERHPDLKVLFASAYSRDTTRVDELLRAGAVDFIQKPYTNEEIHAVLQRVLSQ